MNGLFGEVRNGSQAAMNSFGGMMAKPADGLAEFAPYLGVPYDQGSLGTTEWWKKAGLFGMPDSKSMSGKVGGLIGTGIATAMMGKNFDKNAAMRALAMAMLKDQALGALKSMRG